MTPVLWKGEAAPGPVRGALKKAGYQLVTTKAAVAVLSSVGAKVPAAPHAGPWVWVPSAAPGAAALQAAVERGALDVVPSSAPGWEARVVARLGEALEPEPALEAPPGFVAESAAAKLLLRRIHQAAQTSMPVLLTGETGTGKELAARLIHQWSARRDRTFVPINCAAIPNELMEGELFGYTKGSFSGAVHDYDGLVAAGEGGTVFLDEIDDTPMALQMKLLRVLEDHVISRLGESVWREVDFRTLAATNRDLRPLIEAGTFGADVYERLATVNIELPPLRDRLDDLPQMATQLVERYYAEERGAGKRSRVKEITPEVFEVLRAYRWPGNVRELRNVVFGALVSKRTGDALVVSDLPRRLWETPRPERGAGLVSQDELERRLGQGLFNLREEVEALERAALEGALRRASGNAAEAARLLGEVGRGAAKDPGGTVRTMMRRLGIER